MLRDLNKHLAILGAAYGIKENELLSFLDVIFGIEDAHFRSDILTLLPMGMGFGMDPSKLKTQPTAREEGNVITAYCFRNTILEDIHADSSNRKLDNQTMKELIIQSSARVTNWLYMRDGLKVKAPKVYFLLVNIYQETNTKNWNKSLPKKSVKLRALLVFSLLKRFLRILP